MVSATPDSPRSFLSIWEWIALGLAAIAFGPTIPELVREWIDRPEYSHGFLMPIVSGWVIWEQREKLAALPRRNSWVGLVPLFVSLLALLLGEMKLSFFLKPYALVGVLGSLIWVFRGWRGFCAFVPALIPLLLMCPLPGRVERDLTLPLKNIAAVLATGGMNLTGIAAVLEGNAIHIPGIESMFVADACSGIRSLISLGSIAILAAVFWPKPWWLRLTVVASAVPIAILVNSLRIWLTGVISVKASPELAQGVFHFLEGFVLFALAAAMLFGWAMLLSNLFLPRRTS